MLFKVAWRNIWRNKTRSIVVIASVAVGLFAGMFMMSFFWGLAKQGIDSAVETQLAHIQIHNPHFPDDLDVNYSISNSTAIVSKLRKDTSVKAVSARVITSGMISSSATATGVQMFGIIPSDEKAVSSISQDILEGAYFTGKPNEIVVGKKLADKLGVRLHSKIVLTFQSKAGDLTAGSFRIAGIFRSRSSMFDESTIFINFNDLAQLLGTGNDVHEIAIILKDGRNVEPKVAELRIQYPSLLIQTWKELSPEVAMLTDLLDQIMYYLIGIILLALMFGIINTMLMSVLERQREFGVLMAIGMNKPRIFFMVMMESIMLTCVGIPGGIILTLVTVEYLGRHGINLSAFSKALSQYGFSDIIYPELRSTMFLPIILMTALTAVLSAIYPAIKALQFKPAVAIHKI